MTSISNAPEAEVLNNRPVMIDRDSFRVLIEAALQDHRWASPFSIDYNAWELSRWAIDGLPFEIDRLGHLTDDAMRTILSQQIFEEAPVFLAELKALLPPP
jgi:hypothetical protein